MNLDKPLYQGDGGHGMFFHDKEGMLILALHAPNKTPLERPLFIRVRDEGDRIILTGEEKYS